MLVILMSVGCSKQSEHKKDDAYEFAKIMATGHIENVLGYDLGSSYSLHKVKGNQDEFPYVYQVTKDNEPILHIELEYDTAIHYGGMNFDYKEGYLIPTVKEKYFRIYESDEYLYSVALNHEMNYKDYRDVVIHHLDANHDQEVMDRVMEYLSELDKYMLPEGIEYRDGDLVQLVSPILTYRIELNEENKTIEVSQVSRFAYPVYINNELKCLADVSFHEGGSGFGFRYLDEFPLTLTNEKFITVAAGTAYYQNFFVTENGVSNPEIKYPLYIEKALESIQSIVKNLESPIKIVAEGYIEINRLTEEESMNPIAYKVAEEFIGSDVDESVVIMDEDILYDPDYNELGYNYSLSYYDGGKGHVVVLRKGSSYFVNEASNSENPYEGLSKEHTRVYAGPSGYFHYLDNGKLLDLKTYQEIDPVNVRRYRLEDE